MIKPNIDRVQLPSSMLKVEGSQSAKWNNNCDWACLLIKQTFPSKKNKTLWQILNPHLCNQSRTATKELLDGKTEDILLGIGIPEDIFRDQMDRINTSFCKLKYAACVGVADPTDSLPEGNYCPTIDAQKLSHDWLAKIAWAFWLTRNYFGHKTWAIIYQHQCSNYSSSKDSEGWC